MLVVLMFVLFAQLLTNHESDEVVVFLFSGALLSLVTSLTLFTLDMKRSLHLIHLMVKSAEEEGKASAV